MHFSWTHESVSALWKEVKTSDGRHFTALFWPAEPEKFDLNLSDTMTCDMTHEVHVRRGSPVGSGTRWGSGGENPACCPQATLQKPPHPSPSVLETNTQDWNANKNIQTWVFLHTDNSDGILTQPTLQRWRAQIFADECGLWVTACGGMSQIRLQTLRYPRDHWL